MSPNCAKSPLRLVKASMPLPALSAGTVLFVVRFEESVSLDSISKVSNVSILSSTDVSVCVGRQIYVKRFRTPWDECRNNILIVKKLELRAFTIFQRSTRLVFFFYAGFGFSTLGCIFIPWSIICPAAVIYSFSSSVVLHT